MARSAMVCASSAASDPNLRTLSRVQAGIEKTRKVDEPGKQSRPRKSTLFMNIGEASARVPPF